MKKPDPERERGAAGQRRAIQGITVAIVSQPDRPTRPQVRQESGISATTRKQNGILNRDGQGNVERAKNLNHLTWT